MQRFITSNIPRTLHSRSFSTSRHVFARPPLVRITDGTFHRRQPSPEPTEEDAVTNRPLFPGLAFEVPADSDGQFWAVVGPSNAGKTTFLDIIRGQYLCFPPTARTYPFLSSDEVAAKDPRLRYSGRAIQYVGFDNKPGGLSGVGTYLSARYESRREVTDFSLKDFLAGNTQLNPGERTDHVDETLLEKVVQDLRLLDLMKMPVSNLSNGQTRRARIAKALLGKPELLLLDEPFMGLDPPTTVHLSPILGRLAASSHPRVILSLRPQDPIPDWITHILFLGGQGGEIQVTHRGTVDEVSRMLMDAATARSEIAKDAEQPEHVPLNHSEFGRVLTELGPMPDAQRQSKETQHTMTETQSRVLAGDRNATKLRQAGIGERLDQPAGIESFASFAYPQHLLSAPPPKIGEPVIELDGVTVKYGDKTVLGGWRQQGQKEDGLFWTVKRGERWGVFGPNGSGKTTLLSMISSDHPQAYSQPIKMFGRHRLPSPGLPGLSVFELQSRIGHSSPEVHSFFPRKLSIRKAIESAFADTPLSKPNALTSEADKRIDACLRWFQSELNPSIGWNPRLRADALRRGKEAGLSYVRPQNAHIYKELANSYWYDIDLDNTQSVEWADDLLFGEIPFSAQRVCLFIRAIIRSPDVVILDEAFGGMDDFVRDKCLLFLEHGDNMFLSPLTPSQDFSPGNPVPRKRLLGYERIKGVMPGLSDQQALIVVSHVKEEVPSCVRSWLYLPDAATARSADDPDAPPTTTCRTGGTVWNKGSAERFDTDNGDAGYHRDGRARGRAIRAEPALWAEIWGLSRVYHPRMAGQGKGGAREEEGEGSRFSILWTGRELEDVLGVREAKEQRAVAERMAQRGRVVQVPTRRKKRGPAKGWRTKRDGEGEGEGKMEAEVEGQGGNGDVHTNVSVPASGDAKEVQNL